VFSSIALVLITGLALILRLGSLAGVPANQYYDAAVRSMAQSWHNFLFAAFEPSARLGLDKPPLDLWFQVASVKAFGFHPFVLKLPEAIAGTAAVPLLYDLVRRLFGTTAGLVAALALATLPVAVLTSRSDTMDSLMMALIVVAGWLVVRAAQSGKAPYLYGAAAVLGLAFNVKLFEALVPLPAFALLYAMAARTPVRRRIAEGAVALLVLALVSISWLAVVSLAPTDHRPFAIGSRHGSPWDAAFVFNGVHRLRPRTAGTGPAGPDTGSPAPGRLLTRSGPRLGRTVGSELFAALVLGGLALALAANARDGPRLRRAGAFAIALWLVTGAVGFSAMGRLEVRYLEAFTPAIAAALGAGIAMLGDRAPAGRRRGLMLAALAAAAAYAIYLAAGQAALQALVLAAALAAAIAVTRRRKIAVPLAAAALLALPAYESVAIVRHHRYDSSTGGGFLSDRQVSTLGAYLVAHQDGARYEAAVLTVWQAASLVTRDGRPVLAIRNVDGAPILSPADLRREVGSGNLRYVLAGEPCMGGRELSCPPATQWAQAHGRLVPGVAPRLGLYRLDPTRVRRVAR
jgi:4-amino-4-deoxy-L-arabinose transferase-like glycosyltransferase